MQIIAPTTDSVGFYIRDMLGDGYIEAIDEGDAAGGCTPDSIDYVDDSDPSNLRLVMASGATFRVRVVREG